MKSITKNEVVKRTADYLKANIIATHINNADIYEFKAPNDTRAKPYAVVTTAPSHPQPTVESQHTQQRNVGINILLLYPVDKTSVEVKTTNDQNQEVTVTASSYITAIKNLNDLSDDVINTLTTKEYITSIDMQGVILVSEGEVGIDEDAAGQPVLVYTVEIATHSLLTIS